MFGISTRFYMCHLCLFIWEGDKMFKCVFSGTQSFVSCESLGQPVKTEDMPNLVIEWEACLTFNGNNLHEYSLTLGTRALAVLNSVLKGNTTEFQMEFMRVQYGILANHSGLMNTLALSPAAIHDIVLCPIPSFLRSHWCSAALKMELWTNA